MQTVYPSYYKEFKCIGSRCSHNCCIGWEIDIDSDTYRRYMNVGGEMGARLEKSISHGEEPYFILGENERCPFLNGENLCDIIINLGEECLCGICAEHPRFKNELPSRVEIGLGLACEAAARIILSEKERVTLVGARDTDDEIIILRDRATMALQNREKPIGARIDDMTALCGASLPDKSIAEWAEVFMRLERLSDEWTEHLNMLCGEIDFAGFISVMQGRESEYEQLLVYLIYRYFANAPDMYEAAARAAFAALGYKMIFALGAAIFTKRGSFSFDDQIELCRMFSSEIEYSDENVYLLLDELMR